MKMKIILIFLLTLSKLVNSEAFCQIENLIPQNWAVIKKIKGDFNDDGSRDYFVIIDSVNAQEKWITEERHILIFHGTSKGFILADKNTAIFKNRNRMVESDVIDISVRKNVVFMGLGDMNFGYGYNGGLGYTFRLQNNKWYVIHCNWACGKPMSGGKGKGIYEEAFSYSFITKKYKRVLKEGGKVINKTSAQGKIMQLIPFGSYNGDCDELLK
jgi:hypothetical protein